VKEGSGGASEPFHFCAGGGMLSEAIGLTLFPGMMAFAAASDLLTMRIANRISLILVAGFAVLAALTGMSGADLLPHAGAGAAVLAAGFICFARGWIGGGDAKLAAASALWFGFGHLPEYLLYASLLGGALTLLILLFRAWPLPNVLASREWAAQLHHYDAGVPYGIALAAAALIVYPQTEWVARVAI
jgi:prepilin peptidase CpaA